MPDQTPRLDLPLLMPSQAQKHVTHNEAIDRLDGIVHLTVQAFDVSTPPATPEEGAIWQVGDSPTGLWIGMAGSLARWRNNGWDFLAPREGWIAWDLTAAKARVFLAGSFVDLPVVLPAFLQNQAGLGINTSADGTNRLAVSAPATLLTHDGQGHQLKVNKAQVSDTASLLFQTGWSGRAEMGLVGSDRFTIKVSPDGAGFVAAVEIDPGGRVELPVGLAVGASANDPAVVQDGWIWRTASQGIRGRVGGRTISLDGMASPWLIPDAGEHVMTTAGGGGTPGTLAGAANRLELFAFVARADMSVDQAVVNVVTGVAGALGRVLVYATDSRGRPAEKLLESADIALDTAGLASVAVPLKLWHGRSYWIGFRHSAAPTLTAWAQNSVPDINGGAPTTSARKTLRRTLSFSTPAPMTWDFLSSDIANNAPTAVWFRIA